MMRRLEVCGLCLLGMELFGINVYFADYVINIKKYTHP